MEGVSLYIEYIAKAIEVLGIAVIVIGTLIALFNYILHFKKERGSYYSSVRQELGKCILLGLEILVAADIIATVVTEPTMNRVLTLAIVVLIRTFLSLSIQVEIEGRFPWQQSRSTQKNTDII